MGTAYTSAVDSMPSPITRGWYGWYRSLLTFRLAECPIERSTRYYVAQDEAGDDQGGGGSGTENDPYLVADLSDLQTLIDSLETGGDVRISLRCGDEFAGSTGLTLGTADVTLDSYGTGDKPLIHNFVNEITSGWTQAEGTNRWTIQPGAQPGWIRDKAARLAPYGRCTSTANVEANAGSWFWESGTSTLHINPGAGIDPNDLDFEWSTTDLDDGIYVAANGVRVDGIRCDGWGAVGGNSQQNYPIKLDVDGTDAVVVSNCEGYYCGRHGISVLTDGDGGIFTVYRCKSGYTNRSSDTTTNFNSFTATGNDETIFAECESRFGELPNEGTSLGGPFGGGENRDGVHDFYHHVGDTTACALILCVDCTSTADTTLRNASWYAGSSRFDHVPSATDIEDVRAITFNFRATHPSGIRHGIAPYTNNAMINCRIGAADGARKVFNQVANTTRGAWGAGWCVNCRWDLSEGNVVTPRLFGAGSTAAGKLLHCFLNLTGTTLQSWRIVDSAANILIQNTILQSVTKTLDLSTLPNDGDDLVHNAYHNLASALAYADVADTGKVELTAALAENYAMNRASVLYDAGEDAGVEYDEARRTRATVDIGPVAAAPATSRLVGQGQGLGLG